MPLTLRPSRAGPTLFTLLLLLLHQQASSLSLTIAGLPATRQSSNRLLAAITVSENATSYFITKQLQSYAEACEAGFEIHVILITFAGVWDNADKLLYPTPSKYYCLRLQMVLPVAVATDLPYGLAHQHRHAFSRLVHKYDLFLSQEHDMDIRPRHLLYWTHWRHVFKTSPIVPHPGRPVIPGFLRHEVSMRPPAQGQSAWDHPAALLHFAAPLALLHAGNATCFAPYKSYPGFYLIDRELLLLGMSKRAWVSDGNKTFNEYNVHHQSTWQWFYFHQAVPLAAMHDAMVHHGADKYTPGWIELSSNYTDADFRNAYSDGVDAVELEYLMADCMGRPLDGASLPFPYPSLQGNSTAIEYGWCRGWFPSTIAPAADSGAVITRESSCLSVVAAGPDPPEPPDAPLPPPPAAPPVEQVCIGQPAWLPKWLQWSTKCWDVEAVIPEPQLQQPIVRPKTVRTIPIVPPCAQCAARGQGAALLYRLQGPTLAARPLKPKGLFLVDVMCIPGLPVQEIMPCNGAGCMDDFFINASKGRRRY